MEPFHAAVHEQRIQLVDAEPPTSADLVSGTYQRKMKRMRDRIPDRYSVQIYDEISRLMCFRKPTEDKVKTCVSVLAPKEKEYSVLLGLPDVVNITHTQMYQCELRCKRVKSFVGKMNREGELNDGHSSKRRCMRRLHLEALLLEDCDV